MDLLASSSGSFYRPLLVRPSKATHQQAVDSRSSTRSLSHTYASTSGRCVPKAASCRTRARRLQVSAALFEPPPFQPKKLSVQYLPGHNSSWVSPPASRRYTLTHNDITGALSLSIGTDYNQQQVQGFYTRILRDEITAEWYFTSGAAAPAELHIYCHVSGEERWLAPPQLRNFIFRREMTLVLDTFAYADREFLQAFPDLHKAKVYVHFQSDVQDLDLREYWGVFGDRHSWRRMPRGVLARLKLLLFGFPAMPHQRPRQTLTRQQQQRQQQQQEDKQQEHQQQPGVLVAAAAVMQAAGSGAVLPQEQQQQQQQWHPMAEAAVAPTRPVALSMQEELRRLHSQQQQQQQQPSSSDEQQQQRSTSSALESSPSKLQSQQQEDDKQQQQEQQQLEAPVLATVAGQLAVAALPETGSSNGNGSSNGVHNQDQQQVQQAGISQQWEQEQFVQVAAAAAVDGQQGLANLQQLQQVGAAADTAEVLQEYGYWFRPGGKQQQEQRSILSPVVVLDDSSMLQTSFQPPQQQQHQLLGMRSAVVAAAGSSLNGRRSSSSQ